MSGRISGIPSSPAGAIPDAPADGQIHGRKNNAWTPVLVQVTIGDVKNCFITTDHNGWFKLDGRAVTTLPPEQKDNAALLGFATNLPNAAGAIAYQNGGVAGAVTGSMNRAITQANLPNVTLNSNNAGEHTHGTDSQPDLTMGHGPTRGRSSTGGTGFYFTDAEGSNSSSIAHTHTALNAGAHAHTVALGGQGTAFDFTPKAMAVYTFVFLG